MAAHRGHWTAGLRGTGVGGWVGGWRRERERVRAGDKERGKRRAGRRERSKEVNCPEIFNPVERPRDPLLARRVSNGQDKFPIGSMANRVKRFSRLVILCFHPRSTDVDADGNFPSLFHFLHLSLPFLSFPFLSFPFVSILHRVSLSTTLDRSLVTTELHDDDDQPFCKYPTVRLMV